MDIAHAKFSIGQIVLDSQFHYRGVIVDVDATFAGSEEWYVKNAPHHPPKNEPWYHLLVHNSEFRVYAAESLLQLDSLAEAVHHPDIDYFFKDFKNGVYQLRRHYDV